jgi:hypothetical protein
LAFPEHAAFLLQFNDGNSNSYLCCFHRDCIPKETEKIFGKLVETCGRLGCTMANKGRFDLEQKGEDVEIRFLKEA